MAKKLEILLELVLLLIKYNELLKHLLSIAITLKFHTLKTGCHGGPQPVHIGGKLACTLVNNLGRYTNLRELRKFSESLI